MSQVEIVPAVGWQDWVTARGATVLDVREPHEWALGTLPGAMQIRMVDLPARLMEIDKENPVLVVCRSGDRSGHVAAYLAMNGFTSANMAGGMKALGMQR